METMTSPQLHSLNMIMGLKDSILYNDLTKPRDPGEKDLITDRELLANMYQLEKHGSLQETVHPTKVTECQQTQQDKRQNGDRQRSTSRGRDQRYHRCLEYDHFFRNCQVPNEKIRCETCKTTGHITQAANIAD